MTVNYPSDSEQLSVTVTFTGLLNTTGKYLYYGSDEATILWGPKIMDGLRDSPKIISLLVTPTESPQDQNQRSFYLNAILENFTAAETGGVVRVEFYSLKGGVQTLLNPSPDNIQFDGNIPAGSEDSSPQFYQLNMV